MRRISLLLISFLLVIQVYAQNVNYYSPINTSATGSQLETALSNLITTTHTNIISYSTAYQLLKDANEDVVNTNNVVLIYSGLSDPKSNSYGGARMQGFVQAAKIGEVAPGKMKLVEVGARSAVPIVRSICSWVSVFRVRRSVSDLWVSRSCWDSGSKPSRA